jgi:methionyl-tRNA formyltransferase
MTSPSIILHSNTLQDWFGPSINLLKKRLIDLSFEVKITSNFEELAEVFPESQNKICFLLACTQIIPQSLLDKNNENIVIHESALPLGRGWSPLSWQIEEGHNTIPFTAFQATGKIDDGQIVLQKFLQLKGTELLSEIKSLQADLTIEMVIELVKSYKHWSITPQKGKSSYYPRRTIETDQLDPSLPLEQLFNKLRVADNQNFPAWTNIRGKKFSIKIEEMK